MPRADWSNMIEIPWWMDDQNYQVGKLTKRVRKLRIVNTLTKEEHLLEACTEETLTQIQERYSKAFNCHAKGYMWKRLGVLLDMNSTLDGNHIVDEADKFEMAGMDEDEHLIIIHLYFSDDLTVA